MLSVLGHRKERRVVMGKGTSTCSAEIFSASLGVKVLMAVDIRLPKKLLLLPCRRSLSLRVISSLARRMAFFLRMICSRSCMQRRAAGG